MSKRLNGRDSAQKGYIYVYSSCLEALYVPRMASCNTSESYGALKELETCSMYTYAMVL